MKILVINAGSSSLKYQLIDMETEGVLAKGICERIGIEGAQLVHKAHGNSTTIVTPMPDHKVAMQLVLNALTDKELGVIASMDEIGAVGHRVVASGGFFTHPVVVTEENLPLLEKTFEYAPLHNPAAYLGVTACQAVMPSTPMVLVFDTSFHSTMPAEAYTYAIDYDDAVKYGIRRYGAHGTSHKFVSQEAAKYCGKKPGEDFKVVTCHLGGGCSITAVKNGECIDTSMGFTPLAGVPMGTRSGDIDASAVEFLARKKGLNHAQIITYLNKQSGMLGLSGVSSDFRDLTAGMQNNNERCIMAVNTFCYQTKKYVGAYAAAMGGLDCIVFTAGVAEHIAYVREKICSGLEFLGVKVDADKNNAPNDGEIRDISADGASVKVLIIPTNEELVIARETLALV